MVKIKPFKGLRPSKDKVKDVASPPYDVLNLEEARVKVENQPHSFLHVVKPEIDLPKNVDLYDDKVYQKGRENLQNLIKEKIMVQDSKDCYYLYKLVMDNISEVGLVACASIEDYEKDVIKKHEHTIAIKEADRIKHVDILNANTGPVFLTYKARKEIDEIFENVMRDNPVYDFEAEDDVKHTFWKISDDSTIEKITGQFKEINNLYVADGHHRSASGTIVGQRRRKENPNHTGNEEYNFFLSVIFPHDQLYIMDYNRVAKDFNGLKKNEFLNKVREKFELEQSKVPLKPQKKHRFGMYLDGQWYRLIAKEDSFDSNDPVKSLDVTILQNNLLTPILNIVNPKKDKKIDFIGGIRGLSELERRVNAGESVAFSMFPTSIEELMEIADAGKIMPPKSTWFEPKLRSGIIVHLLD